MKERKINFERLLFERTTNPDFAMVSKLKERILIIQRRCKKHQRQTKKIIIGEKKYRTHVYVVVDGCQQ